MTELLLYNGFTPLRRSPADVFLDNGLGLLRAALRAAQIQFVIEDPASLAEVRKFDAPQITQPLRALLQKQLFSEIPLNAAEQTRMEALYTDMLATQSQKMRHTLDLLATRVKDDQIPVVGIKLWAGSTFAYCQYLCDRIHEISPETIVIAGGPQVNCFSFDGQILKLTSFDAAVYSEGENALIEIVKACRGCTTRKKRLSAIESARIPNTIFRSANGVEVMPVVTTDVNHKPTPEYGDISGQIPVHTLIDALGCDYGKCAFCIHPCIYPQFRKRTPSLVVDEMVQMLKQGIGMFSFTASDTPLSHGVDISEEILKRRLQVEFTILTRAKRNAMQHREKIISQFRTLIRAGLKSVFFGVESANDAVLKQVMNKGVTAEDMEITINCLRKAGELENQWVNIIASFIFPTPLPQSLTVAGVTHEKVMADNLKFLARVQPDSFHAIPGLLYPGTRWYTHAEEFNIRFSPEEFSKKWISQEMSYHGYLNMGTEHLYSFDAVPLQELLPMSIAFSQEGNARGIPSDLWDEHFMLARASNIQGKANLLKLSEDLFLDLLTCSDACTGHLYENLTRHSQNIARSNHHLA